MWAPVAMVAAFMVASWPIVMLFGILTMSSGLLFGIGKGLVVTLVGAVFGGTSVFLLSRFVFRDRVEKWVEADPFFMRLNARIAREGWKLALILRLASMPFGVLNVLFSVTKLDLLPFVLTTLIGEVPVAFIGCFVGKSLGSISEAAGGGGHTEWTTQKIVLFVVEGVMAITFLVAALIISKRMVVDSMNDPVPVPASPSDAEDQEEELDDGTYVIEVFPPAAASVDGVSAEPDVAGDLEADPSEISSPTRVTHRVNSREALRKSSSMEEVPLLVASKAAPATSAVTDAKEK